MFKISRFISAMLFLSAPLFPAPVFKTTAPLSLPLGIARSYLPMPGGGWAVLASGGGYPNSVLHTSNGDGSAWTNSGTLLNPPLEYMSEEPKVIIRTREGGFAIAGESADLGLRFVKFSSFLLIVDSNGAVTHRTYFSTGAISTLAQTTDGGFVMAAGDGPSLGGTWNPPYYEATLIRCNSAGQIIWSRTYPSSSHIVPNALKIATDGSLYLALGVWRDATVSNNAAVLHADAEGNVLRFREYGEAGDDQAVDISLTSDGGFLLLGNSAGFAGSGGFQQAFGVKVDADWNILSAQVYGPYSRSGFSAGMAAIDGKYFALGDVGNETGWDGSILTRDPAAWILTLDSMGRSLVKTPVTLPVTPQPTKVATLNTTGTSPVYDVQGKPGFCVQNYDAEPGLAKVYCLTMEEGE